MRVALLVAGHRFTGAAAVAEHWCRALHRAGLEAGLLFRREGNLQWRLDGCPWARPVLIKERRLKDLFHNLREIRRIAVDYDAVISFLPHDHLLALMAGLRNSIPLIRAFRHPGHLRADPFHAALIRRCDAALLPYEALSLALNQINHGIPATSIPAAVEGRFRPHSGEEDTLSGRSPVVGMVGKMAPDRGFEDAIDIFAQLDQPCRLLLVGHGEAEDDLRRRAEELGLSSSIIFAGKQETRLPELFRSMSVLLFTTAGSDWGHRVISEAQSCGIPVLAAHIPGVEDLVRDGHDGFVVDGGISSVTAVCRRLLENGDLRRRIGASAFRSAKTRSFDAVGAELRRFLEEVVGNRD